MLIFYIFGNQDKQKYLVLFAEICYYNVNCDIKYFRKTVEFYDNVLYTFSMYQKNMFYAEFRNLI